MLYSVGVVVIPGSFDVDAGILLAVVLIVAIGFGLAWIVRGRGASIVKSILIADGDERVAHMFAEVFASHGWRVTWYSDGHRAGDDLDGGAHYDAVLVGYRFEGMDGVALIMRIRGLAHRQDVPIVMVTGTVDSAVLADALAAGADDVLYKPTDVAIVVATVTKCVERRRHQDT